MIKMVISGGQTGVDRAGLDAALMAGIPIGAVSQHQSNTKITDASNHQMGSIAGLGTAPY
jgi:hypothetical protein